MTAPAIPPETRRLLEVAQRHIDALRADLPPKVAAVPTVKTALERLSIGPKVDRACRECGQTFRAGWRQTVCGVCIARLRGFETNYERRREAEERTAQKAAAGLVGHLADWTFQNWRSGWDDAAFVSVQQWLAGWWDDRDGGTLLIRGEVGSGKTHLACAVLNKLWALGLAGRLMDTNGVSLDLKQAESQRAAERLLIEPCYLTPMLVIDDLGREKLTDHLRSIFDDLLNKRWVHGLPTIVTTNLGLDELAANLSRAAQSRLFAFCAEVVTSGVDRRPEVERIAASEATQRDQATCGVCKDAGWVIVIGRPLSDPERLKRCPSCATIKAVV